MVGHQAKRLAPPGSEMISSGTECFFGSFTEGNIVFWGQCMCSLQGSKLGWVTKILLKAEKLSMQKGCNNSGGTHDVDGTDTGGNSIFSFIPIALLITRSPKP